MDWILDRLALGSQQDGETARTDTLDLVLNIGQYLYPPRPGVALVHLPIIDEVFLPASTWHGLTYALTKFLRQRQRVLVHCRLGVSRAPALVTAYLMQCGMGPHAALTYVQKRRPCVAIHPKTWASVLAWMAS